MKSLRLKFILAMTIVEVLMLSILVANSARLITSFLADQGELHIQEMAPLLNAALAGPLVQRDYGTLHEILSVSQAKKGIKYLVLVDNDGKVVAAEGWDHATPLPVAEKTIADASRGDGIFDAVTPIQIAGRTYGHLYYGTPVAFLAKAQSRLISQSLAIAITEVILSVVLLSLLGFWLTRHLQLLAAASEAVGRGEFNINVPVKSKDEVGKLTRAFNTMTEAVRLHVQEVKLSELQQRQLLTKTQQEQARLASLLSAMTLGILFEDANHKVIYLNPVFRRIWMVHEENLTGIPTQRILDYSQNALAAPDHVSKFILCAQDVNEAGSKLEILMADGRVVMQSSFPVKDDGGTLIGRLWMYEDITFERQTAERLIYLAERDSLTGLYNRHRFQDELQRAMTDIHRRKAQGALLFFDLDEFKYVNDTFGHRAGDTMLIRVASEVGTLIRRNEIFSRLGGDEFSVLLAGATQGEAEALAERIVRAVAQIPFSFQGQVLRLTTSLGIALYPQHAGDAEELVSHADAAMYQAKEVGKNAWRLYRADMDVSQKMANRLTWNERIVRALDENLLRLHFQGVYFAKTGKLAHLEVLVRMLDENNKPHIILPGSFVPFAEKSGKILELDRWVIAEAIQVLSKSPAIPALAVNISGRSFDEPSLPQFIADQLQTAQVDARRFFVELTETAAVSDLHDAQRFIEALHQTGCAVCLDDFGSGFASFAYLKHLNADMLKIDGLFIRDLPNDLDNQIFVKAMLDVARGLGKLTVAEFVEDAATLEMLKAFGVDMVQGYHLDRPVAEHPAIGISGDSKIYSGTS